MHDCVLPPEGLKLPNRCCCCTFHYKRLDRSCGTTFNVKDSLAAVEQKPSTLTLTVKHTHLVFEWKGTSMSFRNFRNFYVMGLTRTPRMTWSKTTCQHGTQVSGILCKRICHRFCVSAYFHFRALNRHLLCAFTPSYEDFKAIKHSCFCVNAELLG